MGTRITVEFILELLASGWSYEDLLENYLHLTKEDILDAIDCAASVLKADLWLQKRTVQVSISQP